MHGAFSTGPHNQSGNTNAVSHGAFETLMRAQLPEDEQAAFDSVPTETGLEAELRILRYKLLRLVGDVTQNVVAGFSVKQIVADEPTKAAGIAHLVGEIRKVVKEMREQGGVADPLVEDVVRQWEEGMKSEGTRPVGQPIGETEDVPTL